MWMRALKKEFRRSVDNNVISDEVKRDSNPE